MSMDLEFPKNLPQIRLPPLPIRSPKSDSSTKIRLKLDNSDLDNPGCRTPTAEEHKIPKIISCPGAPRKPKRSVISCKRKLNMELQFFDVVNQEEVEAFFRSAFDLGAAGSSSSSVKRSCCRSA